jgi:hypothetical protein
VFLASPLFVVLGLALIKEWPRTDSTKRFLKVLAIIVGGITLCGIALFLTYWKGYPRFLGRRVAQQAFLIPLSVPFLAGISILLRNHSKALSKLFACFSVGVLVFTLAEPYAILDFDTFLRHTREQTSMVRGMWRPPYTIQYQKTVPYFYHLKQMLWYTMGWPVFTVVTLGVLVASLRVLIDLLDKVFRRELASKSLSAEMIPLVFVGAFFLATGYFQVKFPRYLLPLYPMLFIFAASIFGSMFRAPTMKVEATSGGTRAPQSDKLVRSNPLLAPVDLSGSTFYEDPLATQRADEESAPAEQVAPVPETTSEE